MNNAIDVHPGVDELRAAQLARWESGDRVQLETLLPTHPGLADDTEAVLDLVYGEVLLREEHGERPGLDEYLHRFPHLDASLRRLFSVHEAVASLETEAPAQTDNATTAALEDRLSNRPTPHLKGMHGPYEILEEIGRGGMGIVCKARHAVTGRLAALKMMRASDATDQERARFLTEARAVAALNHPNIVQVYEVFAPPADEGAPFVALEYVAGGSLAAHINGTPLPPTEAAALLLPLADAMTHAHQAGIIHRDLKPANVLLEKGRVDEPADGRSSAATGVPKITDFGLAKEIEANSGQTRTGAILGTPSYMAPEQATGQTDRIGPAADVYALGAILYELLTGRPPFKGATVLDTLDQVRQREPVPPRQLNPVAPRDLETICLKCLNKEPDQRFTSCRELADDMRRYLEGKPIHARPIGPAARTLKWMKRRPAATALLTVIGLILAALVVVWTSFTVRLDEERRLAVQERDRAEEQTRVAQRQSEEAARQNERAVHLLALTAAAVDEIAVNVRAFTGDESRAGSAGAVLFKLATFYAKASATLTTDQLLPLEDRERLAEQYAVSAVRLLNCAEQAGYFKHIRPENRESLDKNPDLSLLRNRADYKKFRERLW